MIIGEAAVRLPYVAGIHATVSVDVLGTVVESASRAFGATLNEAASGLGADADAVADLDMIHVVTDADNLANHLMANAAG